MPWEIADRDHPSRPGPRYAALQRAADELQRGNETDRYYLRWVEEDGTTREGVMPSD